MQLDAFLIGGIIWTFLLGQGDSLWYYSQLFKVNITLLIDSNQNIQPNLLSIGQRVKIPGFVSIDYQIKQGDSLGSIATNRNLPLDALFLSILLLM